MDPEREKLRRWLFEYCEDLAELELLARLRATRDPGALSEVEIATLAGFAVEMTREALRRLAERGLLSETGNPAGYRYAIQDAEVRERVNHVLDAYRNNPLEIMSMLSTNALERVRNAAITTFAECFRFGGPKSRG